MKTEINLARICLAPLAFMICVSSTPKSRGVTLYDEINMGPGYEPVVNCDHRVEPGDPNKRIQYLWTDGTRVLRSISHQLGATSSWIVGVPSDDLSTNIDPFAVCDLWSTDTTVPRIMYFGWFQEFGSGNGFYFARSLSGTNVDSGPEMAERGGGDRPWLAASNVNLFLSFGLGGVPPNPDGHVKRAAIPTGSPTPPVTWDLSNDGVTVFTSDINHGLGLVSNFPITAAINSIGADRVFMMALQHVLPPACRGNNVVRIQRSVSWPTWGDEEVIKVDGFDGFVSGRDYYMTTYHITRDPSPFPGPRVYAFYVRNEAAPYMTPPNRNVLYCKASLDGGATWNGERKVSSLDQSGLPPNGFADVPNCANQSSPGFYRVGRVWSCVDDNGNVYVAWMDNRYGRFGTTDKDYWHVFCSRSSAPSYGDEWSPSIQVSGSSSDPLPTASIGGCFNGGCHGDHVLPGDFLTCDADNQYLYVAWPDSRNQQQHSGAPTQVYFRRIQF